jgi:hypothetical protein
LRIGICPTKRRCQGKAQPGESLRTKAKKAKESRHYSSPLHVVHPPQAKPPHTTEYHATWGCAPRRKKWDCKDEPEGLCYLAKHLVHAKMLPVYEIPRVDNAVPRFFQLPRISMRDKASRVRHEYLLLDLIMITMANSICVKQCQPIRHDKRMSNDGVLGYSASGVLAAT